jgi:uncharacterized membrane protein (UPF0127 family)
MPSFLSAAAGGTGASGAGFELAEQESGRVLVPRLEVAGDSAARRRGLLGRDGLGEGEALAIAPTNAVHTFFMRFPIDIVFVTRAGRVLKVKEAVPAWRIAIGAGAFAVVELAAGGARRAGLEPGVHVVARTVVPASTEP